MLALSGTIAVSAGFALKDLAASIIAGITILFDRPFQVGDRVTFGEYYGEITSIGLRSVRMVTLDDSTVTIPNNRFLTDVVVSGNSGALDMQIVIDFFIAQDGDVKEAKRIVTEAVRTSRFVYLEKPVTVLINDLIQQSYVATRLRAKAYVLDVRYEKAFETDVTERVKQGFSRAEIPPPRVVHQSTPAEPLPEVNQPAV
jgi:small-conductance mechanosensitive channel